MLVCVYGEFLLLIQYIFLQGFVISLFLLLFFYCEILELGFGIRPCIFISYVCKKMKMLSLIFLIFFFRIEQNLIFILDLRFARFQRTKIQMGFFNLIHLFVRLIILHFLKPLLHCTIILLGKQFHLLVDPHCYQHRE